MLKITFDTTPFEVSHCKAPKGRGSWAFSNIRNPDVLRDHIWFSPSMTYAEARKWFKQQLATLEIEGEHVVYVLP
jgi:hypothetical protein